MCNKITKISEQNRFQWIGICSHGSAHIFWRTMQTTISLQVLELLINKALAGRLPLAKQGDEYLLWLNNVAIRLTKKDADEIQELFAYAVSNETVLFMQQSMSLDGNQSTLH